MSKSDDKRQLHNGCLIALFGATMIGLFVLALFAVAWAEVLDSVDGRQRALLVAYFAILAFASAALGVWFVVGGDE